MKCFYSRLGEEMTFYRSDNSLQASENSLVRGHRQSRLEKQPLQFLKRGFTYGIITLFLSKIIMREITIDLYAMQVLLDEWMEPTPESLSVQMMRFMSKGG